MYETQFTVMDDFFRPGNNIKVKIISLMVFL